MDADILHHRMKIYIAASYPRKAEAEALGIALEKRGFEILSYWHQIVDDADYLSGQKAIRDMYAVEHCDLFVELIGDDGSKGGRHCELGLALAWKKNIILIGGKNVDEYCIFANLPWLPRMKDADEFLRKIC